MNENSHADAGEDVGGDAQQQRGQNGSLDLQQEHTLVQHQDEEEGMIIHEELQEDSTDSRGRGDRRREYRRRMTLDPLVDLLDIGAFLDGGDYNVQNEVEDNGNEHDEGSEERISMNIDAAAANNNGSEAAANGDGNDNYFSELELLGELLGRYAQPRSGDDSVSSDEEDGNDNENSNREPPQPARNHSYLPTAQPLYPEEWIPAGQHRHRLSRGGSDISASLLEEFVDEDIDTEEKSEENSGSEGSNYDKFDNNLHGIDAEMHSPSYYGIPEPPTLFHSHSNETQHGILNEGPGMTPTQSDNTAHLSTLAIMEIEDVVLFPGSVIPLRLRDRSWVTYLGKLIDDARGLYGSHQRTAGGMGEVRIVILPRVSEGTRRTRRHPRVGGSRTGRWRVDLIRRGVTGMRRRRPEIAENELNDNPTRTINGNGRTGQDAISMNVTEDSGTRQRQNHSSDEESEDDLFHPTASARTPDDPMIGRIGTMATITFTHEETASSVNPDESLVADANNIASRGSPSTRHAHRPSSMVWRDRGEELVVTVLGTNRVRLVRSMKEEKSTRGRHIQIPLYAVEEIHDGSASLPPSWMLLPPGDIRCSIATPATEPSLVNEEEGEDVKAVDCDSEQQARHKVCGDNYSSSIRNLSIRSSTPAIAYKAMWPWLLCRKIYNMVTETDDFRGLRKILHSAAGLRFASGDEHDENSPAPATDDTRMASSSVQFQVVDPSAFANWIASNMPLSQNDRLDLLEIICTVQQLRYILQKLEEKKQEAILRCKHCGAVISHMRHVFSVGGSEGITGAYVNEHGVVHQTMTIRKVDSHSVVCIGRPERKDSWFPGYSWTIAYCSVCSDHLGWKFRRVGKSDEDDPDRPRAFWGFSSITTDDHVTPRRVAFHARRTLLRNRQT